MNWKWIFIALVMTGCTPKEKAGEIKGPGLNTLAGNWHFLDKSGNYNEAWFTDTTYRTINRFANGGEVLQYDIKNDSFYADPGRIKYGLRPIAGIQWIDHDRVVLFTEFVRDTLARMDDTGSTLQNTDPAVDSLRFYTDFYRRYASFLISKGILTEEEVRAFRGSGELPADIRDRK